MRASLVAVFVAILAVLFARVGDEQYSLALSCLSLLMVVLIALLD